MDAFGRSNNLPTSESEQESDQEQELDRFGNPIEYDKLGNIIQVDTPSRMQQLQLNEP